MSQTLTPVKPADYLIKVPEINLNGLGETDTINDLDLPWQVIIFNDEEHTFEQVENQLQKALGCSKDKAKEFAHRINDDGFAIVYTGDVNKCNQIADVLGEIKLKVEVQQV